MKFTSFGLTAALAASVSGMPHSTRDAYSNAAPTSPLARILLGNSGNIYVADFYRGEENFTLSRAEVEGGNSWMAFVSPDLLYAVDENAANMRLFQLNLKDTKPGEQEILKLDLNTTYLEPRNSSIGVVHLEFNSDKTRLVGSAYGNGTVDIWNTENGGLELIKTIKSDGKLGPDKTRQAAAHPHQANLDPSGRYFAVNDLGTDSVLIIDSKDDAYTVADNIRVEERCGPRHAVFYPRGAEKATHYIIGCELSNQALVYKVTYEEDTLAFKLHQSISTFGKDLPAENITAAAVGEVILAPNNKDLYISNRLTGGKTDSIAHFTVADCGTLTYNEGVSSSGLLPRMISFSTSTQHVFVGNQDGEKGLVALKRGKDGKLNKTPVAKRPGSDFGKAGFGPSFVQQLTL
ncbi:hypothetical protein FDECE_3262 [Fusarium decemcellulare]|nr:hypothetical protein FDECE_3262 [Fusarium decemcellulare]